jgi:Metallo-beta-lactamase superfamily
VAKVASSPPTSDEMEVSLFGPGYGECIVLHLGHNDWIIVDSCIDQRTKQQPGLSYLRQIGVDPLSAVKLVVATHWHDDHVRGLSQVVADCISAEFCCSLALDDRQFRILVGKIGRDQTIKTRGLREFYEIYERLKVRAVGKPAVPPIRWCNANRRLWHRREQAERPPATITSLSPSDASVSMALRQFERLIPATDDRRKPIPARPPNHSSVVLAVEIADHSILLGADLEETGHPGTGWTVIVDSAERPQGLSSIFKVPHHGSKNADQPRVWSEMLVEEPLAILTPFRGGAGLPTEDDKRRICSHTKRAYSTASTKALKQVRRNRVAQQIMRDTAKAIHEAQGQVGHIRLRKSFSKEDDLTVELASPAEPLCK